MKMQRLTLNHGEWLPYDRDTFLQTRRANADNAGHREMPDELPRGWRTATLGDIAELSRDRAQPWQFPDLPYVALEHVEPHTMRLAGHGYGRDVRSTCLRFSKGDVLYGKMRPYLNKVWVAEFDGLCSAEFLVFRKHDGLSNPFLAARLNSDEFVAFANSQVSGERPRVSFEKLAHFRLRLPSLADQNRIVAQLQTALTALHRGEAAARHARTRIEDYRVAVLHAAMTGELTQEWRRSRRSDSALDQKTRQIIAMRLSESRRDRWERAQIGTRGRRKVRRRLADPTKPSRDRMPMLPSNWVWVSIEQLSWAAGYGTSIKCAYDASGPAVLRIPNIRNRNIDLADLKFARTAESLDNDDFVAPGDMLVIRTNGSKDIVGRAAVLLKQIDIKCGFASYLIRFRLVGDARLWSWVSLAWDSDVVRAAVERRAVTTAGQYNLSLSRLGDVAIPVPPDDEMEEVLLEIERKFSRAQSLGETLDVQLERSHRSRQSLVRSLLDGGEVEVARGEGESVWTQIQLLESPVLAQPSRESSVMKASKPFTGMRRSLLTVLRNAGRPLSPEELFSASGYLRDFEESDAGHEVVEAFYDELRSVCAAGGTVEESRPDRDTVLLRVRE